MVRTPIVFARLWNFLGALLLVLLVGLVIGASAGCVTSGDLRELSDAQAKYEAVLEDESKNVDEVALAARELRNKIEVVAAAAEQRTEDTITGLGTSAEGGLVGVAAALALNWYRNSKRKARGEQV